MKADKNYTSVRVCPETKEVLTQNECHGNDAVCPRCGHVDFCGICHYEIASVRFIRPNLFERVVKRMETEFITKEDEDKVWKRLQSE